MVESAGADFVETSRERTPTKALATARDVARVVSFLAATPALNGIVVTADGGLHLLGP
jgi:NAD(P)-dependent dehydrogenase (short-subunit alcohol dehydrogenase family)